MGDNTAAIRGARPKDAYWNGNRQVHPSVDLYHRANGHGLAYHSTNDHTTMNEALAHVDRLAAAWREGGYQVLTVGVGLTIAVDPAGELRGAAVFRDRTTHHLATASAVEHVAGHRDTLNALAALRAATRKDTTRR